MQKENGNSISKEEDLVSNLELAKQYYKVGELIRSNTYLTSASDILKSTKDINEMLQLEAICLDIFDTNFIENNLTKINNKLIACETAIKENNFFRNNKEEYLQEFKQSRRKDIKQNSLFEKSTTELVNYLGTEKRNCLMSAEIYKFLEIRQDNMRAITKEFQIERIAFLEKNIQKEQVKDRDNSKTINRNI